MSSSDRCGVVAPGEKWRGVPSDRLRVSVAPTRGGARFGVSIAF